MVIEIIFDLETKKFFDETGNFNPENLGVSIVSLYKRKLDDNLAEIEGKMFSFWEDELAKIWTLFVEAQRVIGFNSLRFDVPVLKPYAPSYFAKLPHFDIIEKIKEIQGKRVSLNNLAQNTLGRGKTDHGQNAILYYKKGDLASLAKLKKYCEEDVLLTRDIYDFGLKNKYLKFTDFWNNPRKIEVDFSYPQETANQKQTSLF